MLEQRVIVQAQHLVGDTILLPIYSLYSYTYKYKLLREYKYIKLSTKHYVYGNEKDLAPKSVSSKAHNSTPRDESVGRKPYALIS